MATPGETSQAAVEAAERLLELKFPQMDGSCYASLKTTAAGSAGRVPIGRLSSEQAFKARQALAVALDAFARQERSACAGVVAELHDENHSELLKKVLELAVLSILARDDNV